MTATGIAARSDKTRSGLAVGKSPVPSGSRRGAGTNPQDEQRIAVERGRTSDE